MCVGCQAVWYILLHGITCRFSHPTRTCCKSVTFSLPRGVNVHCAHWFIGCENICMIPWVEYIGLSDTLHTSAHICRGCLRIRVCRVWESTCDTAQWSIFNCSTLHTRLRAHVECQDVPRFDRRETPLRWGLREYGVYVSKHNYRKDLPSLFICVNM